MDKITQHHLNNLHIKDAIERYNSFQYIMQLTKQKVNWVYEVWDDLLQLTKTGDNHQRTIAVQVLSNLAKSDTEGRMLKDFDKLMAVTKDEQFVTARHSLQCLWKIGIVNKELKEKLIAALSKRYKECIGEKNCTLIRYDIMVVLRKVFDIVRDEEVKSIAMALIPSEQAEKYRKKYSGVWKDIAKTT